MSTYDFFNSCLNTAKEKYQMLLNTPRARAGNLPEEVKELQRMIKDAVYYDEITEEEAKILSDEFSKIKFENLAKDRVAMKEREKINVGFRTNR